MFLLVEHDWERQHEKLTYGNFELHDYPEYGFEEFNYDDILGLQEVKRCFWKITFCDSLPNSLLLIESSY